MNPRQLEVLGTSAALLYCDKGLPLSEAVYTVVKKINLTADHLKRIQEFANVKAYLQEYERKTPQIVDGNWVRYVSFQGGPAIFGDIMGMLDAGKPASQEAAVVDSKDYETEPDDFKVAKLVSELDLPDVMEKAASVEDEEEMPKMSLDSLYSNFGSAIERVDSQVMTLEGTMVMAKDSFMGLAKQAVIEDYTLGDIRKVASLSPDTHLDKALNELAQGMKSVFWTDEHILGSFEKVSAKMPAHNHPINVKYAAWREAVNELDTAVRTRDVLVRRRDEVLSKIKELRNG